jgi:hypothetical protein
MPGARPQAALVALLALAATPGCQPSAADLHTAAMALPQGAVAQRQLQSRRFDTQDERAILTASAGVLQDLGFSIEETAANSGVITASKDRSAIEAQQVAGQIFLVLLAAAAGTTYNPVYDRDQRIRVTVFVQPSADRAATTARVTLQRIVMNTQNQVSRVETINQPEIYRQFFDMLSQSAFLQAHEI